MLRCDERCRSLEPFSRIVAVIPVFGGFDSVEKSAVDHGLRAAATGPSSAAARAGSAIPSSRATCPCQRERTAADVASRNAFDERRLVEQRVSDTGIRPVDHDVCAVHAANVSRMEVAMDEHRRVAAHVGDLRKPGWKPIGESREHRPDRWWCRSSAFRSITERSFARDLRASIPGRPMPAPASVRRVARRGRAADAPRAARDYRPRRTSVELTGSNDGSTCARYSTRPPGGRAIGGAAIAAA